MAEAPSSHDVAIFWLIVFVGLFTIAVIKRKKQVGKRWDKPFSARLKINGIQLSCHHCKDEHFYKREALIGSTLVTFFNFHYFNQSGASYQCTVCGHLHWFSRPKESDVEFFQDKR
jgi:hypothetical protein